VNSDVARDRIVTDRSNQVWRNKEEEEKKKKAF